MYNKNCEACGKIFKTNNPCQKYCSQVCRIMYSPIKPSKPKRQRSYKRGQLCWNCANATGKCSWSRCLTPVVGWEAIPKIVKDTEGDIYTYKIISCPEFIQG